MVTLEKILYMFSQLAINEKVVNYALAATSVSALNALTVKNYPLILLHPQGQHTYRENTTTYSINIFYIDRLLQDNENDISIFSSAIEELKNYILKIKQQEYVVDVSDTIYFENFIETEGKSDRCAGATARLQITVLNDSSCYIE